MNYKEALNSAMHDLALNEKTIFLGYNVRIGKAGGTLEGISDAQLIETPVAENLMVGMAIGMHLNGHLPVVYFERFDFIMNAMDAIINHLDKINTISQGEFNPGIILRCVVGNRYKPLYTGPTHTQDFSHLFHNLSFPIYTCSIPEEILVAYKDAARRWHSTEEPTSTIIVEYKDLY